MKFRHEFRLKNSSISFLEYESGGIIMRLDFFEDLLRVSLLKNPDDLFQVGCIGLIKSIDNFDINQNVRFSTYAVPTSIIRRKYYSFLIFKYCCSCKFT